MTAKTLFVLLLSAQLLGLAACGETSGSDDPDATADGAVDATPDGVADTAPDALADVDAPEDTAPDGVLDVDTAPDTEVPDVDTDTDADTAPDALADVTVPADTAPDGLADVAADVAADTADADTGPPPLEGTNLIPAGSFESWTAGLPDGWRGAATNLAADAAVEDTSAAHDGLRACRLENPSATHKRLSTLPMALAAGRTTCRYWFRGAGELRHARYDGDYSSYSSYRTATSAWQAVDWTFTLAAPAPSFELVFSVRNTDASAGHLLLDDVVCVRAPEPCDSLSCEPWQRCDNALAACVAAPGACDTAADCAEWQGCDADHRCVSAPGRCAATLECDDPTPVCELASHTCVAGDPCAGVACASWEACDPHDARCKLAPDRCRTTADCLGPLPVCDAAAHRCELASSPANIVPNGGFESWEDVSLGGATVYHLPVAWYGLCDGCSPYFPETELAPTAVHEVTTTPHGGASACQLVKPGQPADRFTTEPFAVVPGKTYGCAYHVRGKGDHRHRVYCGAWGTNTPFRALDSATWERVDFTMTPASSWCVLIFYASGTDAAAGDVQLDDVVCSPNTP